MAFALADTEESMPEGDDDLVEEDFLLLFCCFDRLSDAVGSPMVRFVSPTKNDFNVRIFV